MAQAYGYNAYAGIGVETTYGTAVAGSKWFEIVSENLKGTRKRKPAKTLGTLSLRRTHRERMNVAGDIVLPFQWNGVERLIAEAFGASAVTTTGANPYTHTYALKAATPTGLTVLVNRDAAGIGGSTMFQYDGCHVSKLSLSQDIDEPLMITASMIGSEVASVALQAATFPTFDPIDYGQMTIANYDHGGSPVGFKLLKFSLEIDNKHESKFYLTDHRAQGVHRVDHRGIMFESEIEFETIDLYNAFINASEQDYRFKWMKDPLVDTVNTFQIDIPKAFLDEGEPETSGPGPYRLSLKGTCEMNAADNDELVLVIKNTSSSI